MKHTAKRLTSSTVSALLLAAVLASVSCGGENITPENESSGDTSITAPGESTADPNKGFPALEAKNFGGKDFNLLVRSEWAYEFNLTEETGDTVDDAVYKRNGIVEDTYNVKLNCIEINGAWGKHMDFTNIIHNSVLAGDGAYDAIAGYQCVLIYNIVNGDLLNLNDLKYIELSAPWWTQEGVEALTQNGKCFMVVGDIAVSMLENIQCMYFNKKLAEDYGTPDLYALTREGKWTHDQMLSVTKDLFRDLNGNDKADTEDSFGLITGGGGLRDYVVTYDTPTVSEDGKLVWYNDHSVSVVERLVDAYSSNELYYTQYSDPTDTDKNVFREGRSLLLIGDLGSSKLLRDMEDDFGIIPFPKFDENHEYITTAWNTSSMMCVPVTAPNPDDSAFVLEALCRASTDTVATAFYDVALQGKYARDEESLEMIELIRNSLTFDFGWVSSLVTTISGQRYEELIKAGNKNFTSWYDSNKSTIETKLGEFLEAYN